VVIAAIASAGAVAAVAALSPREDLGELSLVCLVAIVGLLAAGAWASLYASLRPVYLRPWPTHALRGLIVVGCVLPLLLLVPLGGSASAVTGDPWLWWGRCLARGFAVSTPLLAVLAMLDRTDQRCGDLAWLASAFAGLSAVIAVYLDCPIDDPRHLLVAHVPLVVMVGAAYAAFGRCP
jgi:hypothetical protein